MWIYERLGLNIEDGEILSFIGGGGKTTTIFQLGEELKSLGKKVLITTTTAIYNPRKEEYNYYFLEHLDNHFIPEEGTVTILGERVKNGKLIGVAPYKIDKIMDEEIFDFILIEADGANRRPIKVPADHEPVVPLSTTKTIGVVGLDSLDKRIEEIAHRPKMFMKVVEKDCLDTIDEGIVMKSILDDKGLFRGIKGEKILLLNKAYNHQILSRGKKIEGMLLDKGFEGSIIIGDIKTKKFY